MSRLFQVPRPPSFWITPPFHATRFNSFYISSMLSYLLTGPPSLLCARQVGRSVFRVRVANHNVADFAVVRGRLAFDRLWFTRHSSEAQALAMAAALDEEEAFTAPQRPPTHCAEPPPPATPPEAPREQWACPEVRLQEFSRGFVRGRPATKSTRIRHSLRPARPACSLLRSRPP